VKALVFDGEPGTEAIVLGDGKLGLPRRPPRSRERASPAPSRC
jgi:hypothetical protein